jgi:Tfp pilus assembly protein PilO
MPPLMVLLTFFFISIVVLLAYLGYTQHQLKQKEGYLKVTLQEALKLGVNREQLKQQLIKSDTLQ